VTARRLVIGAVAATTLLFSGGYLFIYLYRWEWNRAIISGIIFLAAEVAIVGWALNRRLVDLSQRIDDVRAERIGGHLTDARDQPTHVFDWLSPKDPRANVFVPILMGAGLLLSALAWVVEWLGRNTAGRLTDDRLAARLSRLAPPAGGFLDDSADPLRDLRGPAGARR
jgi:hypothetical protein